MMEVYEFEDPTADVILLQLINDHDLSLIQNEITTIESSSHKAFRRITLKIDSRDRGCKEDNMKRTLAFTLCILTLLFMCGCEAKEQNDMTATDYGTVTITNQVNDADIWILPQTEKNLHTTVWGKATASDVRSGESREAPLSVPGDDGLYIFRMIDTDSFYYSADGILLKEGWSLHIQGEAIRSVVIEVSDENGEIQNTYEVFSARL